MTMFTGLSAFPPTPANADGVVDIDALGKLVDRLAASGVDSVNVLGSTGIYAYLDREQRIRATWAAIEAAAGRVPVIVGIGALRTSWSIEHARAAARAGADGLLLAPMSYAPLTEREAADHFRAVAEATDLPLCIYNNPGTTNFVFSRDLIVELSTETNIHGIKMPPLDGGDYDEEITQLRVRTSPRFRIGYSGDWCGASALLAGADAWHSVVAGVLPEPALQLTRAAQSGDVEEAIRLDTAFEPIWSLFKKHGSLRIVYEIAACLGVQIGELPLPIQRLSNEVPAEVTAALTEFELRLGV